MSMFDFEIPEWMQNLERWRQEAAEREDDWAQEMDMLLNEPDPDYLKMRNETFRLKRPHHRRERPA